MKTISSWLTAASGIIAALFIFACNKTSSTKSNSNIPAGQSQLSVYMMDGPIQMDSVLLDITQVRVEVDTATTEGAADNPNQWDANYCGWGRGPSNKSLVWDTLSITPGIYNLLALRNGTDTLLSSSLITSGKILKIEVTLGSSNKIYTDSTTSYPLVIFGPNNYFTINVSRTNVADVSNNEFKLWLDFNLSRSVIFWNGQFYLDPFFTVFNDQVMAKIQGTVLPFGADALVTAISGADTLYAIPFWTGQYQFRNVPAGTYSISFTGAYGYSDTTISSIVVDSSQTTNVPTITLHK
jgi:hypothetical protein